jgi:hypothetical protein
VKYNELIRILKKDGHKEIGKGLEIRIKKDAGLL